MSGTSNEDAISQEFPWRAHVTLWIAAAVVGLVIGSFLGAAYGMVVAQLFPGGPVSPIASAMVATAAMLAATFHAPLFGAMKVIGEPSKSAQERKIAWVNHE